MAYGDIKRLTTQGQQLTTDVSTIYTAPATKRTQIGTILIHNTDTSAKDVRVFSNTNANSGRILYVTLDASETYEFSPKVPLVLEGSDTLQANASANSVVNTIVFGREEE
jgi:hypothetical protein